MTVIDTCMVLNWNIYYTNVSSYQFWNEWPQNHLVWYSLRSKISRHNCLRIPNFALISMTNHFWVLGHFILGALNDPNYHEHYKVKGTPYMCNWCHCVPNFNQYHSRDNSFWVTGHFETSAPNDLQITLNTTKSKVPRTHGTVNAESQISIRFALWPTVLKLQVILRQVHPWNNPQNDLEHQKAKGHMLQLPLNPHISSFHFRVTCYFETSTTVPKMAFNTIKRQVPNIHVTHTPPPEF